jgi:flagellar basal-body rod protein FlgB
MPSPYVSVVDQIAASMSARSLEHRVIASNIANRDTQGYQRLKVRFDRALEQAGSMRVVAETASAPVALEQDLVALSSNAAQYEAMARVLGRYFSIISAITSYGRG